MHNRYFKYCFLLFLLLLFSCERDVDLVKCPEFRHMLVIASFISPSDSVSFVFISSNKKIYGELNTEKPTGILSGTMSNGTTEVSLDTTSNGLVFSSKTMQIKYGTTYNLKITSENGLSCKASCTVPDRIDFHLNIDTSYAEIHAVQVNDSSYYQYTTQESTVSFSDQPGEDNYYRLFGMISSYGKYKYNGESYSDRYGIYLENQFHTDKGVDGSRITLDFSANSYVFYSGADSAFLTMFLFNTERSYYLYHQSLAKYNSDENPFSEITPVYSNIEGGLGIFTSYTVDSVVYRIK
jgi:hypothetical protein